MADVAVTLRWAGRGLVFRGGREGDGAAPEAVVDGAGAEGPSPMQTLLLALAGCTGADVVDMLDKMRVHLEGLDVHVEGERAPEAPRRYTAVRLHFVARGLSPESEPGLRRAVELSREKYCSVLHTLRTDVVVESDVALQ